MTGFEPGSYVVGSDNSTICAIAIFAGFNGHYLRNWLENSSVYCTKNVSQNVLDHDNQPTYVAFEPCNIDNNGAI